MLHWVLISRSLMYTCIYKPCLAKYHTWMYSGQWCSSLVNGECILGPDSIGHVTLVTITRPTKLVPSHLVKSLQLIRRMGSCLFHLRVPNLQMSYSNLIRKRGYDNKSTDIGPIEKCHLTSIGILIVEIRCHLYIQQLYIVLGQGCLVDPYFHIACTKYLFSGYFYVLYFKFQRLSTLQHYLICRNLQRIFLTLFMLNLFYET